MHVLYMCTIVNVHVYCILSSYMQLNLTQDKSVLSLYSVFDNRRITKCSSAEEGLPINIKVGHSSVGTY